MANRIVGNTYILDTSSANVAIPMPRDSKIKTVTLWSSTSAGEVIFTDIDTGNHLIRITHSAADNQARVDSIYFGDGVWFGILKMPVLTAGTAWIHFA